MSNLQKWENIIKEKRSKTDFRDFLREIGSWYSFGLYKVGFITSKFPDTTRLSKITDISLYQEQTNQFLKENNSNYDFSINFFDNFGSLINKVGYPSLWNFYNIENTYFCDIAGNTNNCYLSSTIIGVENTLYSFYVKDNCKNVLNSNMVWNSSEVIYFSSFILNSYKVFYSKYITNSSNIWFSTNLIGCNNCINCNNLENKTYFIENKQYTKEEYNNLASDILNNKKDFYKIFKNNIIFSTGNNLASDNVSGIFNINGENIINGRYTYHLKNGKNVIFVGTSNGTENVLDGIAISTNNSFGSCGSGIPGENVYCCNYCGACFNVYYSQYLESCSFCLGCIGLKNKSFCILNKQYSKEEWYELADKIFEQMNTSISLSAFPSKEKGNEMVTELGEFFPGNLNPFYFNDTMAYLIDDSFTKEEVEKEGYMWRDDEIKVDIPENAEIVYTHTVGNGFKPFPTINEFQGYDENGTWQINPEIMKKVIRDEKGNYYRIVKMEYDFLVKHGLPLPEIHWLDRIKLGFKFK